MFKSSMPFHVVSCLRLAFFHMNDDLRSAMRMLAVKCERGAFKLSDAAVKTHVNKRVFVSYEMT